MASVLASKDRKIVKSLRIVNVLAMMCDTKRKELEAFASTILPGMTVHILN
jgi:hypothetical protein